jgi:hypothetical protein
MTNPIRYRFEISYQTERLKMVNDFMNRCDLNIGDLCMKDVICFSYSKEEKPIEYFKDLIKQSVELAGGRLVHVEGGKVE